MGKIDELITKSKSFSRDERASIAKEAAEDLISILTDCEMTTENITDFMINIFKMFVSADKKARDGEYFLFKDLFDLANLTTDAFFEMTNYGADTEFVDAMNNFIDAIPPKAAIAVVTIGILIITSDREVSNDEIRLLNKIIER